MTMQTEEKRVKLSLCMIVRDNQETLRKCLDSVKSLVDEIIIVDTGSTDDTKIIALEYTGKVYDFHWKDNFSEAKNHALSKAGYGWVLFLDADESISEKDHDIIRRLINES